MKIEGDKILFSTGKERCANCGIIGLSPKGNVFEGYDGDFWHNGYLEEIEKLTVKERVELAEYMIAQWKKFKVTAEQEE